MNSACLGIFVQRTWFLWGKSSTTAVLLAGLKERPHLDRRMCEGPTVFALKARSRKENMPGEGSRVTVAGRGPAQWPPLETEHSTCI